MKKPNKKKGFTIVELVIVIAVVGVLTAVLVPTFVNLTNRAKEAENQTFVRNLNTQMGIREATEGKNKTMYEAMMEAEDIGYNVEKLTPVNGNDVVWDSVANRFAIVDKDGNEVYSDGGIKGTGSQLWKIYAEMPETQTYSIYAKEGWEVKEVKNLKVGFDAGKNAGIATVSYVGASSVSSIRESIEGRTPKMASSQGQEVVIRTNGGTLTVNAPEDSVHHYSELDKLSIEKIYSESYHEHGRVRTTASVIDGHFVLESDGFVNELEVPVGASATTSVDIKASGTVNTLVDSGNAVVKLENGSKIGQLVASDEAKAKITGEGADKVKAAAEEIVQVSNDGELKEAIAAKKKYIAFAEDIDVVGGIVEFDYNVVVDGKGHILTPASGLRRGINIGGCNATLKNLTIDAKNMVAEGYDYPRGINMFREGSTNERLQLVLDNVKVLNISHYAINFPGASNNVDVTILDSTLSGWNALNLWGFGKVVNISNSTLIGTNSKGNHPSNNFATICFEADTTNLKADDYSMNNIVTISNSTIKAVEETKNIQAVVSYNKGIVGALNNTLVLENCDLQYSKALVLPGVDNGNNKLIVNGSEFDIYKHGTISSVAFDSSELVISENKKQATGSVSFIINGESKKYSIGDAIATTWKDGTDYNFYVTVENSIYLFDLDVSSAYQSEGGCHLYVSLLALK